MIIYAVTEWPDGPGVLLFILYYMYVICYSTRHYNKLFTSLLTYLKEVRKFVAKVAYSI